MFAITATVAGLALVAFLAHEWITAPEGWEDEHGFHYGQEPAALTHQAASSASTHASISIVPRSSSSMLESQEDVPHLVNR